MSIHIDPLPKIPEALRVAASTRRLVPFIGAGVSQLGGSPGWDEFANLALKFFVTHGKLSHAALDQIMGLTSRVKLSVALDLEFRNNLPNALRLLRLGCIACRTRLLWINIGIATQCHAPFFAVFAVFAVFPKPALRAVRGHLLSKTGEQPPKISKPWPRSPYCSPASL
jgi:hypothetical protein